jgi:hypothetical protein
MPTAAPTAIPDRVDAPAPESRDVPGCEACPHPVDDHDAIGLRFCRATLASALDRGCVCPSA